MALMFLEVNGRSGFSLVVPPEELLTATALPSREIVAKALARESALRKSDATLIAQDDRATDQLALITAIQTRVGEEYGLGDRAIDILRCAQTLYPEAPEMRLIPHYVKYAISFYRAFPFRSTISHPSRLEALRNCLFRLASGVPFMQYEPPDSHLPLERTYFQNTAATTAITTATTTATVPRCHECQRHRR
jgi:hypothetical protein